MDGRADLRERLLGWGVLGSDDLSVTQLVFDKLADQVVREGFGEILRRVGEGDFDPLVQIVAGGKVPLGQRIEPRVLEMPHGARLTDRSAGETDDARFFADDLRVLANLALGCCAFFLGYIGWEWELGDFTTHVAR